MFTIHAGDVSVECDDSRTRRAYVETSAEDGAPCDCAPCQNIRMQLPSILGEQARHLLRRAGIDETKPAELIHYSRVRVCVHQYGVVFGLFGRILGVKADPCQIVHGGTATTGKAVVELTSGIGLSASDSYFPLQEVLLGPGAMYLEFHLAEVPWLLPVPEDD